MQKALFYRIFDRVFSFSIGYSYFWLFVYLVLCFAGFELMPFLTFGFPTFYSVGINLDCPANSSFNQDLIQV